MANNPNEKMLERMPDGDPICIVPSFVAMVVRSNNPAWSIVRMASGHAVVVKGAVPAVRKVLFGW